MKKFFTLLAAAVLTCSAAWAGTITTTIFSYAFTEASSNAAGDYDATGGTMTVGIGGKTGNISGESYSVKLDGDYSATSSKYVKVTLGGTETFKAGDVIEMKGWSSSAVNGSNYGFCLYASDELAATCYLPSGAKNTLLTVTYTIPAENALIGKNTFSIFRITNKSTYITSVKITREEEEAPVYTTSVSLDQNTATVADNETLTLTATTNAGYNQGLVWTSSDESVATVDANGVVTPVFGAAGTATITVAAKSGEETTVEATCDVTVTAHTLVPELTVAPTAVSLVSEKINTGTATFTVTGSDLSGKNVTITLPEVEGLTSNVATLPIEGGAVNGTVTLSYKSLVDVAETTENVTVEAGETTATVAVTYSSTAAVTAVVPLTSPSTTYVWDWATAANSEMLLTGDELNNQVFFANYNWNAGFGAEYLEGVGQYLWRNANGAQFFQGTSISFVTEYDGAVTVDFANTGKNAERKVAINGVIPEECPGVTTNTDYATIENVEVFAGKVTISGILADGSKAAMLRIKYIKFISGTTGIENISTENAAAVYYNLQGVRVDNPANGNVYIRVAGGKAEKVLVK